MLSAATQSLVKSCGRQAKLLLPKRVSVHNVPGRCFYSTEEAKHRKTDENLGVFGYASEYNLDGLNMGAFRLPTFAAVRDVGTMESNVLLDAKEEGAGNGSRNLAVHLRLRGQPIKDVTYMNQALEDMQARHPSLRSVILRFQEGGFGLRTGYVRAPTVSEANPQVMEKLNWSYDGLVNDVIMTEVNHDPITNEPTLEQQAATAESLRFLILDKLPAQRAKFKASLEAKIASGEGTEDLKKANLDELVEEMLPAPPEGSIEPVIAGKVPLRVKKIDSLDGKRQDLIFSIPQVIADSPSFNNLIKEILERTIELEKANGHASPIKRLPWLINSIVLIPRKYNGFLGAFKSTAYFIRYFFTIHKWHLMERLDTSVERSYALSATGSFVVEPSQVESLKSIAQHAQANLTSFLAAITAKATYDLYYASIGLPTPLAYETSVNLRKEINVSNEHLGVLVGRVLGVADVAGLNKVTELAPRFLEGDRHRNPHFVHDSMFSALTSWVVGVPKSRRMPIYNPETKSMDGVDVSYSHTPISIHNVGVVDFSNEVMDRFSIDTMTTYVGHRTPTRYTSFTTLPNGKMSVGVVAPLDSFPRSHIPEFTSKLQEIISQTASESKL